VISAFPERITKELAMDYPRRLLFATIILVTARSLAPAADLAKVTKVELQPLAAQVQRIADALDFVGNPLPQADKDALKRAASAQDHAHGVAELQTILDKYCLAGLHITQGKELEIEPGPVRPELAEQGWRVFLVKVDNAAGLSDVELRATSPNSLPLYRTSSGKPDPKVVSVGEVANRFLDLMMFNAQPLVRSLSGLEVEYRILQIYCRDSGRKEGHLAFSLWRDADKKKPAVTSHEVAYIFESQPAVLVHLRVVDDDGRPTTASFVFRDRRGRVYPSQSRRLAPDFGFHPQVYRHYGETVALQPGKYTVTYTRGPEYFSRQREITVPAVAAHTETFELKRWIHPASRGWYSGDHHVHAAGCAHYESPTEGVTPEDMMRHVLGEDLDVGCCLSWGPCWYHQKRYFEGKTNALSTPEHLLRYDVEVSGFPSSHCGHICLLRLHSQDYPGTKLIEDWPQWDLPIFRWAKAQNGVVGFAHSGWGLDVGRTSLLPNYTVPPMDGIGANEYLVDVAHGMCDFISTVDTPSVWELNIWYHTLNCGYRCRISGETDFPCIYGERVGLGRSYVHLDGKLNFDDWAEGIKQGRCYVSDGKSHLLDFAVNGAAVGIKNSEVRLDKPGTVEVRAKVAALLEPQPTAQTEAVRKAPLTAKPYWDIERARIAATRKVPVEVVVNGKAVDRKEIMADGSEQEVVFSVPVQASSWICLRVFPSSHTNPVFVVVNDKPIRASKRSAEWCLKAIDRCWEQKSRRIIRPEEKKEAASAYEIARAAYRKILAESASD
jgi:hypothetical protein